MSQTTLNKIRIEHITKIYEKSTILFSLYQTCALKKKFLGGLLCKLHAKKSFFCLCAYSNGKMYQYQIRMVYLCVYSNINIA